MALNFVSVPLYQLPLLWEVEPNEAAPFIRVASPIVMMAPAKYEVVKRLVAQTPVIAAFNMSPIQYPPALNKRSAGGLAVRSLVPIIPTG